MRDISNVRSCYTQQLISRWVSVVTQLDWIHFIVEWVYNICLQYQFLSFCFDLNIQILGVRNIVRKKKKKSLMMDILGIYSSRSNNERRIFYKHFEKDNQLQRLKVCNVGPQKRGFGPVKKVFVLYAWWCAKNQFWNYEEKMRISHQKSRILMRNNKTSIMDESPSEIF